MQFPLLHSNLRLALAARSRSAAWLAIFALAVMGTGGAVIQAQTQTPTVVSPISLTLSGQGALTTNTYSQNFDSLASSGSSSSLPAGFGFTETGLGANALYSAGNGSAIGGDTYSFGASGSSDRALGTLQTLGVTPAVGAVFVNNSGSVLTSVTISYTGEQWRLGVLSILDRLDFQYKVGALTLAGSGFTDFNALDFTAPTVLGVIGSLDGNAAVNRTAITATITGLNVANGQSLAIRFNDFDAVVSQDGLAIDDFSLVGSIAPVPEPGTLLGGALMAGAWLWSQRRKLRRLGNRRWRSRRAGTRLPHAAR